jgi:AbrB family looped-hinge helix DNA binding protein
MPALEITSMSTKGQIVLPLRVRNDANLKSGTKFAVMTDGENILLKPIETPKMEVFKSLLKRSRVLVKESGIGQNELKTIIKKARNENRS